MTASRSNGLAVAVVLIICGGLLFTYMKDLHFTPERESANRDVHQAATELTNVQDLVAQLKRMVGDEGLRNLAKHEILPGETEEDKAAPSVLKNLRAKGVSYGLSNKDISKMSQEEITLSMHSTLDQTSTVCHRKLRMGSIGDGGWEICDDADVRPRQPCVIYSFGIDNDWSFDDKSSQTYGCHVYSFDPSIKQETYNRSSHVHFYKVGLGGKTEKTKAGWQLYSYKDLRKMLGHENTPIDIVKMDIEHAEWSSVKQMFDDAQTGNLKQFLVEFHLGFVDAERLRLVQRLELEGFKVFYTHKNPACQRQVPGHPGTLTICYEVHYIKRP